MPRPRKEKAPAGQTMNVDPVMSYMGGGVRMLHSPMEGMNHNKGSVSNIINTTTEGSEIRTAMKGIIETSVPAHKQSGLHKAKPTATPTALGMRHISGTTY